MSELEQSAALQAQSETAAQKQALLPDKKKKSVMSNKADYIFMAVMLLFPTLQFLIFYVVTNVNSFALVMQEISDDGSFVWISDFRNFKQVFTNISENNEMVGTAIGNSFIVYFIHLIVSVPICIMVTYYIYRKFIGYRTFKIMLFLPQIVSLFTMCTIYVYFMNDGVYSFAKEKMGFTGTLGFATDNLDNKYMYASILFGYLFFGMGASMLLYLGAMSGINESIIEAAEIDGANNTSLLFRIVLPQIYSTIKTFLVVGMALIFTDQFNLVNMYGANLSQGKYQTLGYYFYRQLVTTGAMTRYPYLAAFGLVASAVLIPVTLVMNKWLDKLDPCND